MSNCVLLEGTTFSSIATKTKDSKSAIFLNVIASITNPEKVMLVFPTFTNSTYVLRVSPSLEVATKSMLPMCRVTQTFLVKSLANIPQDSSIHLVKIPPCSVPCAFKRGIVTGKHS